MQTGVVNDIDVVALIQSGQISEDGYQLVYAAFIASIKAHESSIAALLSHLEKLLSEGLDDQRHYLARIIQESAASGRACLFDAGAPQEQYVQAYTRLKPQRGTANMFLAVDRLLGRLAIALNDADAAASHFEDGLQFCRNAGYRPELAWTCLDYANLLLSTDEPENREKITQLQDEAITITTELGMKPMLEKILSQRKILEA